MKVSARMNIPSEVILAAFLWISLSIFTSKYIVREFKAHHFFACLALSIIFIAVLILVSTLLGAIGTYWDEINTFALVISLVVSTWMLFLAARSFIETTNWRIRENVLFLSVIIAYLLFAIFLTIVEIF